MQPSLQDTLQALNQGTTTEEILAALGRAVEKKYYTSSKPTASPTQNFLTLAYDSAFVDRSSFYPDTLYIKLSMRIPEALFDRETDNNLLELVLETPNGAGHEVAKALGVKLSTREEYNKP